MKHTLITLAIMAATVATAGTYITDIASHYPPDIVADANTALNALDDRLDGTSPVKPTSGPADFAIQGTETNEAWVTIEADDGDDADDTARIAMGTDGNLDIRGTDGTNDVVVIDMSTGDVTADGTVDAAAVTVDAGAGVDNQAAGALLLGAATATSVEIADAGVTTDVQGTLDVDQGLILAYANKTANYTVTATDCVVSYNTSAATTNTLPEASTVLGQVFVVALQDDDGDLVVDTDGTDTFDGTNNRVTFADAGDSLQVMATAANVYTILCNVGGTLSTQ